MGNFPFIRVSGNYRDIGTAIGTRMKAEIKKKLASQEREIPDYNHLLQESGKYYSFTEAVFPQYMEELEAISRAADVSPKKYFFNNNREVYDTSEAYDLKHAVSRDHCTIAVSFGSGGTIVGHNEDWSNDAIDSLYILHATINGTTFLSLDYADAIPGVSAGINSWGLIQCVNDLYQTNQFGVPKNFLARGILECHSLTEAVDLIKNTKRASGFNHVLVQKNQGINIEIAGDKMAVENISASTYVHTNHYLSVLSDLEKFHTESSAARYTRATELVKPNMSVQAMGELLSDTQDPQNPICREEETIASLIFEPARGIVRVSKGHPCENPYREYSL